MSELGWAEPFVKDGPVELYVGVSERRPGRIQVGICDGPEGQFIDLQPAEAESLAARLLELAAEAGS